MYLKKSIKKLYNLFTFKGVIMRICGVDLKANNAIFTVLQQQDDDIVIYIDLKIKKITLEDDENQNSVVEFFKNVSDFLAFNKIDKVVIKKRAKKGNFSGGAVTFKMESMFQLNNICDTFLVSSQAVSSYERKNEITYPNELKKYQEHSYLSAMTQF